MASIQFVKYLVVVIMNLCQLDEVGEIFPMRLSPHFEKGQGVTIGWIS
jgi:hypothetical protein